jgi:prepilin-type N-terminal cleavage/methylation domain-containing protein
MKLRLSKEGLTLVELLVVIGIIAVLAGILWVVLAPVRERARQVHCINNLKQIHHALMLYREDYGAYAEPEIGTPRDPAEIGWPCISYPLPPGAVAIFLDMQLAPYLTSKEVWRCLNDPRPLEELLKEHGSSYVWRYLNLGCWYKEVEHLPRWHTSWWLMERFREMTATCGDRMPIAFCPWHGLNQETDSYAIILRWNGQVKGQYIQLPYTLCLD